MQQSGTVAGNGWTEPNLNFTKGKMQFKSLLLHQKKTQDWIQF